LAPFFADPARSWIAHNAKFDAQVLATEGLPIAGTIEDSLLLAYLLDPGRRATR